MVKTFSKIINGDLESGIELSKELLDLTLEDTKTLLKQFEQDIKKVQKGTPKKVFLGPSLKDAESAYQFIKGMNSYIKVKIEKEKERAWKFLNDEKEAEKAGWYSKKPQDDNLLKWAEKAYGTLSLDLWEEEVEIALLKAYLKTF